MITSFVITGSFRFLQTQYIVNWEENDEEPDPIEVVVSEKSF